MKTSKKFNPSSQLWITFGIFLLTSGLLSYGPFSLTTKFTLFLFGITLPFWLLVREGKAALSPERVLSTESLPAVPLVVWVLLGVAALFLRFYKLDSLSVWPVLDEARNASFGMDLAREWHWQFFRDNSQMPPLFYWLIGFYFKFITPSLFSMWLFPALLSILALPLGYLAARKLFSKSFAFLFACLLCLGFYPVYVGRFNHQAILILLWESLALAALVHLLKAKPALRVRWAILLGLVTGTGFYIYFAWPFVALGVGLVFLAWAWKGKRGLIGAYLVAAFLAILPLAVAALRQGYGSYIQSLWLGKGGGDLLIRMSDSFSYLTALFWGLNTDLHAYKPFWGGYLNPILDACFFIGLAQWWRARGTKLAQVALGLTALFLAPAFIAKEIEMFRVAQILPVLLFTTGLGMQTLLTAFPLKVRPLLLGTLLVLSAGSDFYHLAGPYHQACSSNFEHWNQWSKSEERWRANDRLRKDFPTKGPYFFFLEFDPYPFDKSLSVAAYPLSLKVGSPAPLKDAQSCVFMANVNYRPFLETRFPEATFEVLSKDVTSSDEGMMMVVVPVAPYRDNLWQWAKADEAMKAVDLAILNRPTGRPRTSVLKSLAEVHPALSGDPYLESLFWNLAYLNHAAEGDLAQAQADLEQALQKGYPTAYFYNELGGLFYVKKDYRSARVAFEKAVGSKLNDTPAAANLVELQKQR